MDFAFATKYLNVPLMREPLNWAIIWVFASIWLLAFHVVMTGFGAMHSDVQPSIGAGPGQIASPVQNTTADFSQVANYGSGNDLGAFYGNGMSPWTDTGESKYAEDGWISAN